MSEGGGVSAGRRISRVSKVEVEDSQFNLENLFKKYCQGEDGMNETQFVEFATLTGLTGKKCSSVDCAMIFQAVKLGKKTTLNFDRFTEAVRKIAVKSELTYQEVVQCAADHMASRTAATTNVSIPAGVDPALLSPKGGVKLPEGTDAKRDSKARLDAFMSQVPNRKSSASAKLELFMSAVEGADGTTEKIDRGEPNADEAAALLATISADLDAKDALGTVGQLETAAASDEVVSSVLAPVADAVKESNELFSAGKMEEALAKLNGAVDLLKEATNPPNAVVATVYSNQGAVLQKLGRFEEAETALKLALEKNADSSNLHNTYGATLHSQGKKEQALVSFKRSLELQPGFILPIKGCMDCSASLNLYQDAADYADQVLAQDAGNNEALRSKGFAMIKLEKFEDALAVLRQSRSGGDDSNEVANWMQIAVTQLAVKAEEAGDTEKALGYYKDAIGLERGEPSAQLVLSHALLLSKSNKMEEAITALRGLITKEPAGGTGTGGYADAQAVLGELLVRQMDFEGAEVPLRALCEEGQDTRLDGVRISKKLDLLYSYAMTLAQTKKLGEADAAFTRVLALDPDHADAQKAVAMLKGAADGSIEQLVTGDGKISAQVNGSINNVYEEQKAAMEADQAARAQEEAAAAAAADAKAEADRAAANADQAGTFPYDQLQNPPFPAGVDSKKREIYLSDSVFETVLGMSKADFAALPGWKASSIKKKANLF
jgi:tetratricopeptide (TPR) repeat protein